MKNKMCLGNWLILISLVVTIGSLVYGFATENYVTGMYKYYFVSIIAFFTFVKLMEVKSRLRG